MVIKDALGVLFIGFMHLTMAQLNLTIDDTQTIEDAVIQSLTSDYYTISNVTAEINIDEDRLASGELLPSFGTYNDPISYFGLDKGLILTNGAAKFAEGPNNSPNKDQVNTSFWSTESIADAHVNYVLRSIGSTVVGPDDTSSYDLDAILVEFDIVSTRSEIAFDYIFATEEYPYPSASAKIDPIAIFISGPGVVGEYQGYLNIATYQGGIITPELINHSNNSAVYNSNGTGASPFIDFYTQYDGYTNKFRASTTVVPCETYHVKMMVIDEDWNYCDAALMVQPAVPVANDLPLMNITYDDDRFQYGIEGCHHATLRVERSEVDKLNMGDSIVYSTVLLGDAEHLVDYSSVPEEVVIPVNALFVEYPITILNDALDEGTEEATIELYGGCDNAFLVDVQLVINDAVPFAVEDIEICLHQEGQFNPDGNQMTDSIIWSPATNLSCVSCVSPLVTATESTGYLASFVDRETGCAAQDSAYVWIDSVESAFDFHYDDHYTTLDLFFDNHSVNSVTYDWSFGDGNVSTEFEPLHTYDFTEENESLTFEIELIVTSSFGCKDTSMRTLVISDPLYIPNIFTPNGDLENDAFEVLGIQRGVWTLKVYNRWGKKVYESENYDNDWDGNGISDGVYYWYLENPVGDRQYKGWVVIIRG